MAFLIDSNVLIDVSRGNSAAIEYVDRLADPWALSQVSAMELIVGARDKRDLAMIDGFCRPIRLFRSAKELDRQPAGS